MKILFPMIIELESVNVKLFVIQKFGYFLILSNFFLILYSLFSVSYKPKVKLPQFPNGKFSRPAGSRATVLCEIISSPPPSVKKWMKGSTVIDDCSSYTTSECILSIGNAKHPKDSGDYYCVGENKIGETRVKLDLQITGMKFYIRCFSSFLCIVVL